jgi:predicted RecA/RadA family phage recombinase
MAVRPQFLYGDPRPVECAFDTADTTITFDVGNLIITSSGNATNMGTSTTVTNFLGVSAQKKAAGVTQIFGNSTAGRLRVDTDGVWEYDRSDTIALNVGDVMTTDGTTANTLAKAGAESVSIARVVEPSAANSTRVRVKIQSRLVPNAPIS